MHIRTEFKIGLFAFLGLFIFFVIVFSISDFSLKQGYTFSARFNFVNGLETSSPVRLAGVKIGEVKEIKVDDGYLPVEVDLWIKKGIRIKEDSQIYISSLGLLGDKCLEILPGNSQIFIKPTDIIVGRDPISVEEFSLLGKETIEKANKIIGNLEEIIGNEEVKGNIKKTVKEGRQLSENLNITVAEANKFLFNLNLILEQINSGEGTIGRLISDESLYNEIEVLIQDIKKHPWKLFHKTKEKGRRP
ncbi:MAG: MCE family protein [Candidatus Omnitrophica bacterium]|nr:MCE family protein [Candidatus Omnitrophota bacterium]